jgi:hypothetical protein
LCTDRRGGGYVSHDDLLYRLLADAGSASDETDIATERRSPDQLGALPPLGTLLHAQVYVDPEVLGHDTVTFAAGTQTESVRMQTQGLFGTGGFTTVSLVKRPDQGGDDPVGRRRAAQQAVADGGQPAS